MPSTTQSSIRLLTEIPGPKSRKLQEQCVPRGVGSALPMFIHHASGAVIEDVDGNRLLDFTGGIGCQNAGHRPSGVVEAIKRQADRFLHTCFMVTPYEDYVRLAQELNRRTRGTFPKKTFFVNSGAERSKTR